MTTRVVPGLQRRTITRRGVLRGSLAVGVLGAGLDLAAMPYAFADGPTSGLPTGTAPEQVHLTWGADPTTAVTVSWATPGSTAMPNPTLHFSTSPIGGGNPGTAAAVVPSPYTDGMNLETVRSYHAAITGLSPDTKYFYEIGDGAGATFDASFTTAPAGRVGFTFSSVGDIGTPKGEHSASGLEWAESSDNAYFAIRAIEATQPLFHLLNGDLCYANLNTNNQPEVWRDFGANNQASAANRPWMPALGNHEIEFGTTSQDGSGAGYWNGAYGHLSYQSRYLLPDNGIAGYRGKFYSFRVGTVLFVSLDADDVIYQDGGANYVPGTSTAPLTATNPAVSIPAGTTLYNREYTGKLTSGPDETLVPDVTAAQPNLQTQWLRSTLQAARADASVDMIVVQLHQCALSSSSTGNGSDLGIRQAWIPLFDEFSVDLVLCGHDHNYERSYPVRGYDPGPLGTVVAANPGQTVGAPVETRRPRRVPSAGPFPTTIGGSAYDEAYDTSQGTVYLVLGGGGTNGPTAVYGGTAATPVAKVITQRNAVVANGTGGFTRNGADSTEPAPWSAMRDPDDAYGFALFTVDPGSGPGQTSIVMRYSHAPAAAGGSEPYQGTTAYSPLETVVFGRQLSGGPGAALPEFATPVVAAGAALAVGAGAAYLRRRRDA